MTSLWSQCRIPHHNHTIQFPKGRQNYSTTQNASKNCQRKAAHCFKTELVNSWPLTVYLFNFCLIPNESLLQNNISHTTHHMWLQSAEKGSKRLTRNAKKCTRAHTHTRACSLSSVTLRHCDASSAGLHNGDRLPNVSAPRKQQHTPKHTPAPLPYCWHTFNHTCPHQSFQLSFVCVCLCGTQAPDGDTDTQKAFLKT